MKLNILVVEDQKNQRERLYNLLSDEGYNVESISNGKDACVLFKKSKFHIALLDMKLPDMSGMEILKKIKKTDPDCLVLILTAYGTIKTAIEAIKQGAYDFITKPYDTEELLSLIFRATEFHQTRHQNKMLKAEIERAKIQTDIIYKCKAMQSVMYSIQVVAKENSNVLIQGESGTGKELVAQAIHRNSNRCKESFIVVNCAAFQESLLESELFGHEKGSFTGADLRKHGLVELADKGTLFLDEVGELSPQIQAKLLRFVENGEFRRVGGVKSLKVNVRIVSATNKPLSHPEFRQDLYYRLNVINIIVPPLREREDDIELLANHFLSINPSGKDKHLSSEVKNIFRQYSWPGNIRELHNIIEQAIILSSSDLIEPGIIRIQSVKSSVPIQSIPESEKDKILSTLACFKGHREKAARALGISVRTLYRKLKSYNIDI